VPALNLVREAGAHVVAGQSTVGELAGLLRLASIATVGAAAALFARLRGWKITQPAPEALVLILAWWLVDPVSLFAFSRLSGHSVFVPRYMDVAAGMALALAGAVAPFLPMPAWRPLSLAMAAGALIFMGSWSRVWPAHHNSDWRAAAQAVRESALPAGFPVCPSPFVEARPPVWRPDYPIDSFLYSNLLICPLSGKLYPFPYEISPDAERDARQLWNDTFSHGPGFAVFEIDRQVMPWREWFRARPETAAWRDRKLGGFGGVSVVVFEAPTYLSPSRGSAANPPAVPATSKALDR
jgi:hypothetical protein